MMMIARVQGSHALGIATSNEATASLSLFLSHLSIEHTALGEGLDDFNKSSRSEERLNRRPRGIESRVSASAFSQASDAGRTWSPFPRDPHRRPG